MATFHPTAEEQYLLELINRARANPLEEVKRNPDVADLNQGLAPGTLDATAKQPLAFNLALITASRDHSQWMLDNDVFSHTGEGSSSAGKRMADAGYEFSGAYTWGENLSWRGTTGTLDLEATIPIQHDGLFESPGHRTNLMNGNFKEIGLGILSDNFRGYNASMITQNFAKSGDDTFLTGVIFDDSVVDDDFYTIGEGIEGVEVRAVRQSDGQTFETDAFDSGGYSLALDPGTYDITFSGAALGVSVTETVTIGETNVKLDVATDVLEDTLVTTAGVESSMPVDPFLTPELNLGAAVPEPEPMDAMANRVPWFDLFGQQPSWLNQLLQNV